MALVSPPHLIDPHRVVEAAEHYVAPVGEEEPLPRDELAHNIRGEDVTAPGLTNYPRRSDY